MQSYLIKVLLLFLLPFPLLADSLTLKNSDLIQGNIREITPTEVLITTEYGPYLVALDQILEIRFSFTPVKKITPEPGGTDVQQGDRR